MGDRYRSLALAELVSRHYSPPLRVADVAGGSGVLNDILTRRGFEVVTIDPELRFREDNLKGIRARFEEAMAADFGLIVGLHPDSATEQITYAAKYTPVIVVPCCKIWEGIEMKARHTIRGTVEEYFRTRGINYAREALEISGPNIAFRTLN